MLNSEKDIKKICFAASSGGHYEQLMMLEPLMKKYNSFIVTEKTKYKVSIGDNKVYYLLQVNRKEILFLIAFITNFVKSFYIFVKEKPDAIICTGVLATIPLCILCKLFRKKVIYIESFAKINSPTLTGKIVYKFADLFLVQWESMLKVYPKAKYIGGIY